LSDDEDDDEEVDDDDDDDDARQAPAGMDEGHVCVCADGAAL
jgi:hypothetical protein